MCNFDEIIMENFCYGLWLDILLVKYCILYLDVEFCWFVFLIFIDSLEGLVMVVFIK